MFFPLFFSTKEISVMHATLLTIRDFLISTWPTSNYVRIYLHNECEIILKEQVCGMYKTVSCDS